MESYALNGVWTKLQEYDDLNRLDWTQLQTASGQQISAAAYTYTPGPAGVANSTPLLVASEYNNRSGETLYYDYNSNGNLYQVRRNGTVINRYQYDSVHQWLIREDNRDANRTYVYTYDDCGNILTRRTYTFQLGDLGTLLDTDRWDYDSSGLGKLYQKISAVPYYTYDSMGNPTYNVGKGTTYTWEGTQLVGVEPAGATMLTKARYEYGADGARLRKYRTPSGGKEQVTEYLLDGDKILREYTYTGSLFSSFSASAADCITYYYDEAGDVIGLNYYGTDYYYYKNIFGDVLGIMTPSGTMVVRYSYDAWGNILSITGSLANSLGKDNPFRYRSYYYDNETGWYYLQSRYYDPSICRFISPDSLLQAGGGADGLNLYAYCLNNPVNMTDSSGHLPRWATITLGALAAVAAVAVTVATLGAAAPAAACTLTSAGMYLGASYAVASTAAMAAVATTTAVAATYAGDIAYSAITGNSLLLDSIYFRGNQEAYDTGLALASFATSGMLEAATLSPGVCFVEGTPVLAECGHVAIEEIRPGDLVWASDPETGETALREVVQLFRNETNEWIHITVGKEEIVCTPNHPFYSPVKGWTNACNLRAGDILVTVNGEYVIVEQVQHELLESPETTYNFEVEGFHTYYVGKQNVLVHISCGKSPSRGVGGKGWVGDKTWRENVSTVSNGGTITSLNGGVPTQDQALQLINQSGGTALRIEGAHQFPNPHTFTHINYTTSTGIKGTIKIFE